MRVLAADRFDAIGVQGLETCDCDVRVDPHLSGDSLAAMMGDFDPQILIVRSTRVTQAIIDAANDLSLIIRAGAGVNTIDIEAASKRGIYVANCPGMNAAAVAELVFGLMISLDRRIAHNINELREGTWNKEEYAKARGLKGGTLGIVGLGKVGHEVARRANAFDMRIVYYDVKRHQELESLYNVEKLSLEDLLRQSDYVTLHVPLMNATRHLINEQSLRLMKPSARLINTSRGEVVDQKALGKALEERWIAGAGLDVYEQEPSSSKGEFKDPVLKLKDLYGTHHIGAATEQAQAAVAEEVVRIVRTYKESGDVPNCVNVSSESKATHVLVVRHYNQPGILAHILGCINEARINVEEMLNIVYTGAKCCCAHVRLGGAIPDAVLDQMINHEMIISVKQSTLPDKQ